jgi:hypothetical protein
MHRGDRRSLHPHLLLPLEFPVAGAGVTGAQIKFGLVDLPYFFIIRRGAAEIEFQRHATHLPRKPIFPQCEIDGEEVRLDD